jgi:hypothetical protein
MFKEKLPDQPVGQGWKEFIEENGLLTLKSHHNSSFSFGDGRNDDVGAG